MLQYSQVHHKQCAFSLFFFFFKSTFVGKKKNSTLHIELQRHNILSTSLHLVLRHHYTVLFENVQMMYWKSWYCLVKLSYHEIIQIATSRVQMAPLHNPRQEDSHGSWSTNIIVDSGCEISSAFLLVYSSKNPHQMERRCVEEEKKCSFFWGCIAQLVWDLRRLQNLRWRFEMNPTMVDVFWWHANREGLMCSF